MPIRSTASRRHDSHFVPNEIRCPKCATGDFIRFEHVINGHNATKLYFCGACAHEWMKMSQANHGSQRSSDIAPATPVLERLQERRNVVHRNALARRLQGEFKEVSGLCLTPLEAARLFGLAPDVCQRVLVALVAEGVLTLRSDGHYVRRPSSA